MGDDGLAFADARELLAARLSLQNVPARPTDVIVTADQLLGDPATADTNAGKALLLEANALADRFALASRMLARGWAGDPATETLASVKEAQTAAFNLEGIPRYDHLFILVFENHNNQVIDAPQNVNFYSYLNLDGNKAANYFSTGSPSEPNYVSLGSADDWGITDDSGWNCVPANRPDAKPTDVFNPRGDCTNDAIHNIIGRRNMFSAMYGAGLGTRVYSESMDPGMDPRNDGHGNPAIMGVNKRFGVSEAMPGGLYRTKHHPAVNFDDVRNRPDFFRYQTRSVGGGQWDDGITAYATDVLKITWNTHQLEDDLVSGDIGALNYIVPDQCDDIHGVNGTPPVPGSSLYSVDCDPFEEGIQRGDAYLAYLVSTIKASPIWNNPARRVGIVLLFDEGSVFAGSASCCGWNANGGATSAGPTDENIPPPGYPVYAQGNQGDGPTVFGVMNNQPNAPKGIVDSDSYSHFSLVRTLQDMFALADPGVPESYMNRSKYTEAYIQGHLAQLPEFQGSADTHFDGVRPMNHHYAVQPGQQASNDLKIVLPDTSQTSIWALK
jgi:hypothetical protein